MANEQRFGGIKATAVATSKPEYAMTAEGQIQKAEAEKAKLQEFTKKGIPQRRFGSSVTKQSQQQFFQAKEAISEYDKYIKEMNKAEAERKAAEEARNQYNIALDSVTRAARDGPYALALIALYGEGLERTLARQMLGGQSLDEIRQSIAEQLAKPGEVSWNQITTPSSTYQTFKTLKSAGIITVTPKGTILDASGKPTTISKATDEYQRRAEEQRLAEENVLRVEVDDETARQIESVQTENVQTFANESEYRAYLFEQGIDPDTMKPILKLEENIQTPTQSLITKFESKDFALSKIPGLLYTFVADEVKGFGTSISEWIEAEKLTWKYPSYYYSKDIMEGDLKISALEEGRYIYSLEGEEKLDLLKLNKLSMPSDEEYKKIQNTAMTGEAIILASAISLPYLASIPVKSAIGKVAQVVLAEPITTVSTKALDSVVPPANTGFAFEGLPQQLLRAAIFLKSMPYVGLAYGTEITKSLMLDTSGTVSGMYEYTIKNPYEIGLVMGKGGYESLKRIELPDWIKTSKPFTIISGYAKNVKGDPAIKNVLYSDDIWKQYGKPGNIYTDVFRGYEIFMEEKVTLSPELSQRLIQGIKSESKRAELYNQLGIKDVRDIPLSLFEEDVRATQLKILESTEGGKVVAKGSLDVFSREIVRKAYKELFNEERVIGDVDLGVKSYVAKNEQVNILKDESIGTLKAKANLLGEKELAKLTDVDKIKYYQKNLVDTKFDIEQLGITDLQRDVFKIAQKLNLKLVGTPAERIFVELAFKNKLIDEILYKDLLFEKSKTSGELIKKTLQDKDLDFRARTRKQYNQFQREVLELVQEKYPEKYSLVERKIRELDKGRPLAEEGQLGAFKEPDTLSLETGEVVLGKTRTYGEAVEITSREIGLVGGKIVEVERIKVESEPQKGGMLGDIEKTEAFKEQFPKTKKGGFDLLRVKELTDTTGEPYKIDVSYGFLKEKIIDKLRPGKDLTILDTTGKELFDLQKKSSNIFDVEDRLLNAPDLKKLQKAGGKEIDLVKLGFKKETFGKVTAKDSEALMAEKILELADEKVRILSPEEQLKYKSDMYDVVGIVESNKESLLLYKDGVRSVIVKKPKVEGGKELKISEAYNVKDFSDLIPSKTEIIEVEGKKLTFQGRLSSNIGKVQAEIVRGRFGEIDFLSDKDFKDISAVKKAEFDLLKTEIQKKSGIQREILIERYNRAVQLAYEYEGALPVSSKGDIRAEYLKSKLIPTEELLSKANQIIAEKSINKELMEYKPQAIESKLKVDIENDISFEQLKNKIYKEVGYKTSPTEVSKIKIKLAEKLEKLNKKDTLNKQEAQNIADNLFKEIENDVKEANKKSAKQLQKEYESGEYFKDYNIKKPVPYVTYTKYTDYSKYSVYDEYYKYEKYAEYGKYADYPKYPKEKYGKYNKYPGYAELEYGKYAEYPKYPTYAKYPEYKQPPYEPKKDLIIFPIELDLPSAFKPKPQPGFNVYAKEVKLGKDKQARVIQINTQPVTKKDAMNLGAYAVDESLGRTFTIKPTKQKAMPKSFGIPSNYYDSTMSKFREFRVQKGQKKQLSNTFIEKASYMIDTEGERKKISVAQRVAEIKKVGRTPYKSDIEFASSLLD